MMQGVERNQEALMQQWAAGREAELCLRVLAKTSDTLLTALLGRDYQELEPWQHYPADDVYDREYHAQYYYHIHPRPGHAMPVSASEEHGHFHAFLRPWGMPEGIAPSPQAQPAPDPDGNGALSHLIAIGLNAQGWPMRLFTTNRWVTGETWYAAEDVTRMLDRFIIDHARPSWPLNRWLTAMVTLFRPTIIELLQARDRKIKEIQEAEQMSGLGAVAIYDDRRFETLSEVAIDFEAHVLEVEKAARRARRGADRSLRV
jgi:hypothetical protein